MATEMHEFVQRLGKVETEISVHVNGCGKDWAHQQAINEDVRDRVGNISRRLSKIELEGAKMSGLFAAIGSLIGGAVTVLLSKWIG